MAAWLYVIYFDTNFESYSQHGRGNVEPFEGCMLSTLIQILKAIHNSLVPYVCKPNVVCYLL